MIMRSLETLSKTRETSRSYNMNASPHLPRHEIIEWRHAVWQSGGAFSGLSSIDGDVASDQDTWSVEEGEGIFEAFRGMSECLVPLSHEKKVLRGSALAQPTNSAIPPPSLMSGRGRQTPY